MHDFFYLTRPDEEFTASRSVNWDKETIGEFKAHLRSIGVSV